MYNFLNQKCIPLGFALGRDLEDLIREGRGWVEREGGVLPVILGRDEEGRVVMEDYSKIRYLLVSGLQGSGKTNELMQVLISMMAFTPPEVLRLWIFDANATMKEFAPIVNGFFTKKSVLEGIKILDVLLELKIKQLGGLGFKKLIDYNASFGSKHSMYVPMDVIVVDEATATLSEYQEAMDTLMSQSERGRSSGVWQVKVGQSLYAKAVGGSSGGRAKSQFAHHLAYYQKPTTSQMVSETLEDLSNLEVGEGYYIHPRGSTRISSVYIRDENITKFIQWCKLEGRYFRDRAIVV